MPTTGCAFVATGCAFFFGTAEEGPSILAANGFPVFVLAAGSIGFENPDFFPSDFSAADFLCSVADWVGKLADF